MASFLGLRYISPLSIMSEKREFRSETLSLRIQTLTSETQRWRVKVGLEYDTGANKGGSNLSVHRAEHSFTESFEMEMPQWFDIEDLLEVPQEIDEIILTANTAGSKTISINSVHNFFIPKGWFLKFSNHTKVYQVTSDVDHDANDAIDLPIFPALQRGIATTDTLDVTPNITVYYAQNMDLSVKISGGIVVKEMLDVVEAL